MDEIQLSLIIVAYNSGEALRLTLQSVRQALSQITHEVIIVDNNSDPGTLLDLPETFSEMVWIKSEVNLGFGRACNLAAKRAKYPTLFFVNPDTICTEETFLGTYRFLHSKEDSGIVGCRILNSDGTLQLACRRSFPDVWSALYRVVGLSALFPKSRLFGKYNLTYLDPQEEAEVDAVSGSFFALRKEDFLQVQGFDSDFFMYGEDLDLCYRIQSLGKRNYYTPDSSVIHLKGRSAATRRWRSLFNFYRAMEIFAKKHRNITGAPLPLVKVGINGAFLLALLRSIRFGAITLVDLLLPLLLSGVAYKIFDAPILTFLPLFWPLVKVAALWAEKNSPFFLAQRRRVIVLLPNMEERGHWDLLDPQRDLMAVVAQEQTGCHLWKELHHLSEKLRIGELILFPDSEGWWCKPQTLLHAAGVGVPVSLYFEEEGVHLSLPSRS